MSGNSNYPEFLFPEFPPDPPKKKAPARTVNADAGNGVQDCKGTLPRTSRILKPKGSKAPRDNSAQEDLFSIEASELIGEKSPFSGKFSEKATSVVNEKTPSVGEGKTTSYYLPMVLSVVVSKTEIKSLLLRHRQAEWASRKRIAGLLMIIDHIARKGPGTTQKPGTPMSSELARQYVSNLKRAKSPSTIQEPLPLLVEIGILEIAQQALVAPHRKTAARYRLHSKHGKPRKTEVMLSTQQRDKLQKAGHRNEQRLNRKHPFRRQLLLDLEVVGLSANGRSLALTMMTKGEKESNIKQLLAFIDGGKPRQVTIDPCGTIHTFARLAPRELKPHLTLREQSVVICDIQSAHLCVLSCVAQERIAWLTTRGLKTESLEKERRRFIALLESADIYGHLADGGDRSAFKKSLLSSINMPTAKSIRIEAYQQFRREFPQIVGIIEDIKKKGHHGISRPLQHHTARIINAALGEAQKAGIPCIPDTDALIIPASRKPLVLKSLNTALLHITGVRRN